jgi:hypothetical protein
LQLTNFVNQAKGCLQNLEEEVRFGQAFCKAKTKAKKATSNEGH